MRWTQSPIKLVLEIGLRTTRREGYVAFMSGVAETDRVCSLFGTYSMSHHTVGQSWYANQPHSFSVVRHGAKSLSGSDWNTYNVSIVSARLQHTRKGLQETGACVSEKQITLQSHQVVVVLTRAPSNPFSVRYRGQCRQQWDTQ